MLAHGADGAAAIGQRLQSCRQVARLPERAPSDCALLSKHNVLVTCRPLGRMTASMIRMSGRQRVHMEVANPALRCRGAAPIGQAGKVQADVLGHCGQTLLLNGLDRLQPAAP